MIDLSKDIRIRDLAKELERGHKSNRLVERFLFSRVQSGLTCGKGSAQDIKQFVEKHNIEVEFSKNLILKINWMIFDYLKNQHNNSNGCLFEIKEIEGNRMGYNFAWWMK